MLKQRKGLEEGDTSKDGLLQSLSPIDNFFENFKHFMLDNVEDVLLVDTIDFLTEVFFITLNKGMGCLEAEDFRGVFKIEKIGG